MLEHHIQRSIVARLLTEDGLRFSDMKLPELDNKAFTYHLQKTMRAGLVKKTESGMYVLTEEGRRLGKRIISSTYSLAVKPHSVLFLIVRRSSDGAWLLYTRKTHPLKDKIGFMHAAPSPHHNVAESAALELQQKTGLNGAFNVLGSGFFRIYQAEELESYTQFTLLVCEDAAGELAAQHEGAEYAWVTNPDFTDAAMLPNMPLLVQLYNKQEVFFIDESLTL